MSLKDSTPIGMSLPHRSLNAIDMATVRGVAQRSEALGFSDLWVAERSEIAKAELDRWFSVAYHRHGGADAGDIYRTPAQVREQLEALVAAGANHLLFNPVGRYVEQVEALAEVVGLS
jgi:alkanesulfonate monooxygenase SsuD/methylene tetrahydromethanopterin reductase-like flavin-dependent oxidoreductase (luciferase family)